MLKYDYGVMKADEGERVRKILPQSLHFAVDPARDWIGDHGADTFRVVRNNDTVVGGLQIIPWGQWFGGKSVSMGGIACVGIAPESRGKGAAGFMLRGALREMYENGFSLSTLYPATQTLYRTVGYQRAGYYLGYECQVHSILKMDRMCDMIEMNPDEWKDVKPIYDTYARMQNGMLDRNEAAWNRILNPSTKQFGYLILKNEIPVGYLIYALGDRYDLTNIRDMAALDPAAYGRILTFFADDRSMIHHIQWRGAPADPLVQLLPEQTAKPNDFMVWMIRVVNARKALRERGYPLSLNCSLDLEIADDILPENSGRVRLEVADGSGNVSEGGSGEMKLSVDALASLYAGFLTATELHRIGWLQGDRSALDRASLIFGGTIPWMPDHF